jgi:hypothetical protein
MHADLDILNWTALADTPAALERDRVENGEPVASCGVAGLQYHSYRCDDGLGGHVSPQVGERLVLAREPDNRHDRNAIEVWWRNEHRLGHLPWEVAAHVAGLMDSGQALRAYVLHPGDGTRWSLRALLVGEAARVLRPDLPAATHLVST